jgi:hypothetical protein
VGGRTIPGFCERLLSLPVSLSLSLALFDNFACVGWLLGKSTSSDRSVASLPTLPAALTTRTKTQRHSVVR